MIALILVLFLIAMLFMIHPNHGHFLNCDDIHDHPSLGPLLHDNVICDFLSQGHFFYHESIVGHPTLGHRSNCDVVHDRHAFWLFSSL
jgi:hypothetical protein